MPFCGKIFIVFKANTIFQIRFSVMEVYHNVLRLSYSFIIFRRFRHAAFGYARSGCKMWHKRDSSYRPFRSRISGPEFPFELAFDDYHRTLEAYTPEYMKRGLRIAKGIEIGIQHDQLDRCREAASSYDYDYIIGSFHCALGEPLYEGHFFDGKTPKTGVLRLFRVYVRQSESVQGLLQYRSYESRCALLARYG